MRTLVILGTNAWLLFCATAAAQTEIDMKGKPFFEKQLAGAAESVKKHLVKETTVAGLPVRLDLGNEGGVSVKSAVLKVEKVFPLKGKANLVFDLHFRHVVTKERTLLGQKIPAVIAYDRHEEVVVEYDINTKQARARVLRGPFKLEPLPQQDYELWVELDLRNAK